MSGPIESRPRLPSAQAYEAGTRGRYIRGLSALRDMEEAAGVIIE